MIIKSTETVFITFYHNAELCYFSQGVNSCGMLENGICSTVAVYNVSMIFCMISMRHQSDTNLMLLRENGVIS